MEEGSPMPPFIDLDDQEDGGKTRREMRRERRGSKFGGKGGGKRNGENLVGKETGKIWRERWCEKFGGNEDVKILAATEEGTKWWERLGEYGREMEPGK